MFDFGHFMHIFTASNVNPYLPSKIDFSYIFDSYVHNKIY